MLRETTSEEDRSLRTYSCGIEPAFKGTGHHPIKAVLSFPRHSLRPPDPRSHEKVAEPDKLTELKLLKSCTNHPSQPHPGRKKFLSPRKRDSGWKRKYLAPLNVPNA